MPVQDCNGCSVVTSLFEIWQRETLMEKDQGRKSSVLMRSDKMSNYEIEKSCNSCIYDWNDRRKIIQLVQAHENGAQKTSIKV